MKSVLISIKPEWCEKIVNGKKTIEVRKNKPNLETPFKCYVYCTKGMDLWLAGIKGKRESQLINGKVIGEFICDYVQELKGDETASEDFLHLCCMQKEGFDKYRLSFVPKNGWWGKHPNEFGCHNKTVYGWHISDFVLYDKPKELGEFYCRKQLTRPPQSWCYVEDK